MKTNELENYILIAGFMGYTHHLTIKKGYWNNKFSTGNSPSKDLLRLCNPNNDGREWIGTRYESYDKRKKYNSDWNELMKVVEKIETIDKNGIRFGVSIEVDICSISSIKGLSIKGIALNVNPGNKIKSVYQSVVDFIKWYNKEYGIIYTYETLG